MLRDKIYDIAIKKVGVSKNLFDDVYDAVFDDEELVKEAEKELNTDTSYVNNKLFYLIREVAKEVEEEAERWHLNG